MEDRIINSPLDSMGIAPPVLGIVQDSPAVWDWRLVLAFVALGVAGFFWF